MIGCDQRWRAVALALIGAKIVYLAGISGAVWLWPDFEAGRPDDVYRIWFPEGWPRAAHGEFGRHFATWDAEHYLYLSEAGYVKGARSCAFFALWSMVIMGGSTLSEWPSRRSRWHDPRGSILDRCGFALLVYCLPVMWRRGKDLIAWTLMLGILPAMSGTFFSFIRFESTAFPLFIALAVFFIGWKRRWPFGAFLAISAVLHGMLLWQFVNYRWAG